MYRLLKLNNKNLFVRTIISNDTWNNVINGEIIKYYLKNKDDDINNYIGYINYRINTGQIGLIRVDERYRKLGIGKQMLTEAIEDLKNHNIKSVWGVTSENHYFWSNVYSKSFQYKNKLHKSVSGKILASFGF